MGEIIDRAFWKFGGPSTSSDRYLMGPWQNRYVLKEFEDTFRLMDYFYGTNLKRKMDERYKTGFHPTDLDNVDIEDFFTRLDKMLKGEESYRLNLPKNKVGEIYKKAAFFFYYTLSWTTAQEGEHSPPEHYLAFVEKVLTPDRIHCIISFHYDMLLEASIFNPVIYSNNRYKNPIFNEKYFSPKRLPWTYGINFDHICCNVPYSAYFLHLGLLLLAIGKIWDEKIEKI